MLNISNSKKEKSFERNSLSLNNSTSFIQLKDDSYKKIRNKNYKELYIDKLSYYPNSSSKKKLNNSMNYYNKSLNESLNENYNLKTFDINDKRKKTISFSENINFYLFNKNNDKNINNNSFEKITNLSENKNIYVNQEVKEQIIRRALDKYNKSFTSLNSEKLNNSNNNNLNDSSLKLKQIKNIETIENENYNLNFKKKEKENQNNKIITVFKDNFPYKKYELDNKRKFNNNI